MLVESVTYAPRLGYPLHIVAKRYWLPAFESNATDPEALTLIFLHSTSFHKETWEPAMEHVFSLASKQAGPVKIREAWAVDCPNHGESAVLNEDALKQPDFFHNFTCEKYARAVHHFLSAGPDHGAKINFRSRNLVGIGHSLGGVAISILQHLEPRILFSSIILVEPMLNPAGPGALYDLRLKLVKAARKRRDVWPNREQALLSLRNRQTAKWDPRVLNLFVKYGLRALPGPCDKGLHNQVTLACTRDEEVAMYEDADGATKPVGDLNMACSRLPVHLVLGAINDFIPRRVHDVMIDPKSGRRFASITKIEGAGHLLPQEVPEKLGTLIFNALTSNSTPKCKL